MTVECDLWNPFKIFKALADGVIYQGKLDKFRELKTACSDLHVRFLAPLKNPARDATSKAELEKARIQGAQVPGTTTPQVLNDTIVDEAFVISDVFQVNEMIALDLVLLAESQVTTFPGLPRGLVAVLLYYDARKDFLHSVADIFHWGTGRAWDVGGDMEPEVAEYITSLRDDLIGDGLIGSFIDALANFSVKEEWEKLGKSGGLGNNEHRRMVLDMLRDIRRTIARVVFNASAQVGLSSTDVSKLLRHLRRTSPTSSSGSLDDADVALFFAALYAIVPYDPAYPDGTMIGDASTDSVRSVVNAVHGEISHRNEAKWECPGAKAALQVAWGLSLRQLTQKKAVMKDDVIRAATEDDEAVVDAGLAGLPFGFLKAPLMGNPHVMTEEFYLRSLHGFITDFIILMPMKAKELRNAAASCGIPEASTDKAVRNFIDLAGFMEELYSNDPLGLQLSLDFWMSADMLSDQSARHISLHQFVTSCGTIHNPYGIVYFIEMVAALGSSPRTAPLCFDFFRSDKYTSGFSSGEHVMSWDHFIRSLDQYCSLMRQDQVVGPEGGYVTKSAPVVIKENEIHGLKAVLKLIENVAKNDPVARMEFLGRSLWNLPSLLFGLVTCPVTLELKASTLRALTALVPKPTGEHDVQAAVGVTRSLWAELESSQLLKTSGIPPNTPVSQRGDICADLEEVENRMEEFILTRAFIDFLKELVEVGGVPNELGAPTRHPGFGPYLNFVVDSVFLKFSTRVYKDRKEAWKVAQTCLGLLQHLVSNFPTVPDDFILDKSAADVSGRIGPRGPGPGYLVMRRVIAGDGDLVRMAMYVAEECVLSLEQEDVSVVSPLWNAGLASLKFLGTCLDLQAPWQNLYREALQKNQVAFPPHAPIDRVLVGSNQRSGRPGYLVSIAKFLPGCRWAPFHTKESLGILHRLAHSRAAQAQMLALFTSASMRAEILHGFVQCLDDEENELDDMDLRVGAQNRQSVLRFILRCLTLPAIPQPNVAHFLLGFNINAPLYDTSQQSPGVMNAARSCLHSIVNIVDIVEDSGPTEDGEALRQPLNSLYMPVSAVLCYQILYKLCSNEDTGPTIVRYLRNAREFVLRHLQMLPFYGDDETHLWEQMGYLLKLVALDLTVSASKSQRSHLVPLVAALLDPNYDAETSGSDVKLPIAVGGSVGQVDRARIAALLKLGGPFCLDAELVSGLHDLELLEPKSTMKVMDAARVRVGPEGPFLYSLPRVKQLLDLELSTSGLLPGCADYVAFQADVDRVLEYATRRNAFTGYQRAMQVLFDGWRQVAQVFFHTDPENFVDEGDKQRLLVHLIEVLLDKCDVDDYALPDMIRMGGGALLVMTNCLTHSFIVERNTMDERSTRTWGVEKHADAITRIMKKAVSVITKDMQSDRTKVYLYSVIGKLVLAVEQVSKSARPPPARGIGGPLPDTDTKYSLRKNILHILNTHRTSFYKNIAEHCFAGFRSVRMTAMHCLSVICSLSRSNSTSPIEADDTAAPAVVLSKNVFQRLLSEIVQDDRGVADELGGGDISNKWHLNGVSGMFRAKVYLLTVAAAAAGNESQVAALIDGGLISTLTQLACLHRHPPQSQVASGPGSIYELKHREIFLPAMRLVDTAFRRAYRNGQESPKDPNIGPVLSFFAAFHDNVLSILKMNHPWYKTSELTETSAFADLFALLGALDPSTIVDTPVADSNSGVVLASVELRNRFFTYRRLFVRLLGKYLLSDHALDEIDRVNDTQAHKTAARMSFFGIVANIVTFACESIAVNESALKSNTDSNEVTALYLFSPSLMEGTAREVSRLNESQTALNTDQMTSLGVVVYQLKKATAIFLSLAETEKKLTAQLSSGAPPVTATPASKKADLNKSSTPADPELLETIKKQKKMLSVIIEGCTSLISYHLQQYLLEVETSSSITFTVKPPARNIASLLKATTDTSSPSPPIRREDIVQLKADMSLALTDSLFLSIKQVSRILAVERKIDILMFDSQVKRLQKLAAHFSS